MINFRILSYVCIEFMTHLVDKLSENVHIILVCMYIQYSTYLPAGAAACDV
jgi:hypothetical protein